MMRTLLISLSFFLIPNPGSAQKIAVTLDITNVLPDSGLVRVAVFDRQNYLKDVYVATLAGPASGQSVRFTLLLPPGEYAFTAMQDFNRNNKMDKSPVGVPREPYGFSNGVRARFRAPRFDAVKVRIDQPGASFSIGLQKW